jgi:hypothetical protein
MNLAEILILPKAWPNQSAPHPAIAYSGGKVCQIAITLKTAQMPLSINT